MIQNTTGHSTFSHIHKVGKNGINANFVFSYICSCFYYLYLNIIVIVKLNISFRVGDFIGLFHFEWHFQNEVGNVAILVLWRDRE